MPSTCQPLIGRLKALIPASKQANRLAHCFEVNFKVFGESWGPEGQLLMMAQRIHQKSECFVYYCAGQAAVHDTGIATHIAAGNKHTELNGIS